MDETQRLFEVRPLPPKPSLFGSFVKMIFSFLLIVAVVIAGALLTIPDITQLERCMVTSMFQVKLCPGSPSYVQLKDISPYMIHAVIVAEDGSFYSHKGFDWKEIQESLEANLKAGGAKRGGSTLTQQLAKNVFLSQEKSLWRKLKEAYLAYGIETHYKKDFILEKYLNVVEFGPGLYGVKNAAEHYFKKPPSQLHPLEAAWLAHLLPNPKVYSQAFRKGALTPFSKKMVMIILRRMAAYGKLSPIGYERAESLIAEFPWIGITMASFSTAPSWSLETDVPLPKASDLEYDPDSVEKALEESADPQLAAPEPVEETEDDASRELNSINESDFD